MNRVKANPGAERAVLSGLCRHGSVGLAEIEDTIDVSDFSEHHNQVFFTCIKEVLRESEEVDPPTIISAAHQIGLYEQIKDREQLDYLRSLFNFRISLNAIRKEAVKLGKISLLRDTQEKLLQTVEELGNFNGSESVDEIVTKVEGAAFSMADATDSEEETMLLFEEAEEYVDFLAENPTDIIGISSGFPIYDQCIGGGFRRGAVNLLGARPKTGKTTIAKEFAQHCAVTLGIPVLFLDTEMNHKDQIHRNLSSLCRVSSQKIETGKFAEQEFIRNKVKQKARELKGVPYYYRKIAGKPFDEVLSIMRRWIVKSVGKDENGNTNDCLIIYDYFKLMDAGSLDNMQEYQALGFQISKLTDFINTMDVSCSAFVQVNRDGVTKETSDIISQSDRLLWLCTSFALLKRKSREEQAEDGLENGNSKLIPMDCRFAGGLEEGDYINLNFEGEYSKYSELNTKFESKKKDNGFETEENDEHEENQEWSNENESDCPFDVID